MESCGEGDTVRCLLENAGVFTEMQDSGESTVGRSGGTRLGN